MVFSTQTMISSRESNIFDSKNENIINERYSFFINTLNAISEDSKIFYSELFESFTINNKSVLNESYGSSIIKTLLKKIDVKKIISGIFERFMNIMDTIWDKFKTLWMALFSKDRIIQMNKKSLETYQNSISISKELYSYTNIGIDSSSTMFENKIKEEYDTLLLDMSNFATFKDYNELYGNISDLKSKYSDNEYNSKLRGEFVNKDMVEESEFANSLFLYFRGNGFRTDELTLSAQSVRNYYTSYVNFKSVLSKVELQKKQIKKSAKEYKNKLLNINLEDYVKINIPSSTAQSFVSLINVKLIRVKNICDYSLQYFSAKIDALKDSYNDTRYVLYEACKEIVRGD